MAYVDVLILRHLAARPAHGYELRKRVEATTGTVLHNNSLYPALHRFEAAGAVVRTSEAQEGRPARNIYSITDVGRELLHDLLADLPEAQAGDDVEFLTRLGQFGFIEPAERSTVLDARDRALRNRVERLRGLRDRSRGELWSGLVTSELIRRDELELEWLGELRALAGTEPVVGAAESVVGTEESASNAVAGHDSDDQA